MKKSYQSVVRVWSLLIWLSLMATMATAQTTLQHIEYYIDTDPGLGNGVHVSTTGNDIDVNFNINLSSVNNGIHDLFVRVKDNQGDWSFQQKRTFIKFEGTQPLFIDRIEYYVDSLGQPGEGVAIPLTPTENLDTLLSLVLPNVDAGVHKIMMRVRQQNGTWSLAQTALVYVSDQSFLENAIKQVTYYFDGDENNLYTIDIDDQVELDSVLSLDVSNLSTGMHTVHIAAVDAGGMQSFLHQASFITVNGANGPEITEIQYFYGDTIPTNPDDIHSVALNASADIDTNYALVLPNLNVPADVILNTRVKSNADQWSLFHKDTFNYCPTEHTLAGFDKVRFGNTFSFIDTSRAATSYHWDFGDGTVDSVSNPLHEFSIGTHIVTQTTTNFCGSDSAVDTLLVDGVESYSPSVAGRGGNIIFTIYGAGLDSTTEVSLTMGGNTLLPTRKKSSEGNESLACLFDLHEANTGFYDVTITLPNSDTPYFYPAGFEVTEADSLDLLTEILAPSRIRTNRWTNATLTVANNTNRLANGVFVVVAIPDGVETNLSSLLREHTIYVANEYYNRDSLGGYVMDYDTVAMFADSLLSIPIDTLQEEAFSGRAYELYIPFIEQNSTFEYPFKVRATVNGNYSLRAYNRNFTMFGSPMSAQKLAVIHDSAMAAGTALGAAPHPIAKFASASFDIIDGGSKILFQKYFDAKFGTNVADAKFIGETVVGTAVSMGVGYGTGGVKSSVVNQSFSKSLKASHETAGQILKSSPKALFRRNPDEMLTQITKLRNIKLGLDEGVVIGADAFLSKVTGWSSNILLTTPLTNVLNNMIFGSAISDKNINSVASMDPNEISGNTGHGTPRYIQEDELMSYIISYENVDTALAAAQIVNIYDTLDAAVYDFSTFEFGNIHVKGEPYNVPSNRQEYTLEVDYGETLGLILRVNMQFDTLTGVAHWQFLSLDTNTMDLVTDVLAGFLPPNVNYPEGEGNVSFSIELKDGLLDNQTIENTAFIYFDENPPIQTNTWLNTIDSSPPVSSVSGVTQTSDSTFVLNIQATDDKSGIGSFALYSSVDGSDYRVIAQLTPQNTSVDLQGEVGIYYSFYTVATDKVGNIEQKNPQSEAYIVLINNDETITSSGKVTLYPNPVKTGKFTLVLDHETQGEYEVKVYDLLGREVHKTTLEKRNPVHISTINTEDIPSGMYIIEVRPTTSPKEVFSAKLIISGGS